MKKSIFTILLLLVCLFFAKKLQSFVKNNAPVKPVATSTPEQADFTDMDTAESDILLGGMASSTATTTENSISTSTAPVSYPQIPSKNTEYEDPELM